jgi:RHS repeat-associated protein
MTYNDADQMTQKTDVSNSVTILSLGYTPDNIGLTAAEASKSYAYDTINRVHTSTDNGGSTYTYDNADRLTQLALTGANTTTNAYNNADEITSLTIKDHSNAQVQQYTYTYDNGGNRTQQTDQSSNNTNLGYDQANRMISWSGGGHSATYAYNGDGLRQSKTVDSVTTSDVWMPVGQSVPVIVVDKIGATSAYYLTGSGGAPLEQITGTTPYYFHSNMLGSTRKLTDAAGAVQQSYDYDPYGNLISLTGSVANPLQFAGQYTDSESGLYYLRARYYDPASAQFLARDPLGVVSRMPYQYVSDNPTNQVDATGLESSAVQGGALEAASKLAEAAIESIGKSGPPTVGRVAHGCQRALGIVGYITAANDAMNAFADVPDPQLRLAGELTDFGSTVLLTTGLEAAGAGAGFLMAGPPGAIAGGVIAGFIGGVASTYTEQAIHEIVWQAYVGKVAGGPVSGGSSGRRF